MIFCSWLKLVEITILCKLKNFRLCIYTNLKELRKRETIRDTKWDPSMYLNIYINYPNNNITIITFIAYNTQYLSKNLIFSVHLNH